MDCNDPTDTGSFESICSLSRLLCARRNMWDVKIKLVTDQIIQKKIFLNCLAVLVFLSQIQTPSCCFDVSCNENLWETLVKWPFCTTQEKLHPLQFASRTSGCVAETACTLLHNVLKLLDDTCNFSNWLFRDFSFSFYCIQPSILASHHYIQPWFRSGFLACGFFLTDNSKKVRVNNIYSRFAFICAKAHQRLF